MLSYLVTGVTLGDGDIQQAHPVVLGPEGLGPLTDDHLSAGQGLEHSTIGLHWHELCAPLLPHTPHHAQYMCVC